MFMVWSRIFIAAAITFSVAITAPVAQAQSPAAQAPSSAQAPAGGANVPKPSRVKLTKERIKEMFAKWHQNRPKLKACRAEARKKGLDGDDRWFFIEDCMDKS
jgi:hypothetical protein